MAKNTIPTTATVNLPASLTQDRLLRLPQVLAIIPIPKSSWWAGVKKGIYPQGLKLSLRTTVWRESDIKGLIDSLSPQA